MSAVDWWSEERVTLAAVARFDGAGKVDFVGKAPGGGTSTADPRNPPRGLRSLHRPREVGSWGN